MMPESRWSVLTPEQIGSVMTLCVKEAKGFWIITKEFHIESDRRPIWLHRFMVRLLLGWEWKDA